MILQLAEARAELSKAITEVVQKFVDHTGLPISTVMIHNGVEESGATNVVGVSIEYQVDEL